MAGDVEAPRGAIAGNDLISHNSFYTEGISLRTDKHVASDGEHVQATWDGYRGQEFAAKNIEDVKYHLIGSRHRVALSPNTIACIHMQSSIRRKVFRRIQLDAPGQNGKAASDPGIAGHQALNGFLLPCINGSRGAGGRATIEPNAGQSIASEGVYSEFVLDPLAHSDKPNASRHSRSRPERHAHQAVAGHPPRVSRNLRDNLWFSGN
jgi:hypothetical protein